MASKFTFDRVYRALDEVKRTLPEKCANLARNHFSKSFIEQGWEGKPWKEVNRRIPGTVEYKYPKKKDLGRRRRPILVGKGSTKLRRAVANSIRVMSFPTVRLVVDLPYARRHNEGLDGMPQRKYFGNSKKLHEAQQKLIRGAMREALKKGK